MAKTDPEHVKVGAAFLRNHRHFFIVGINEQTGEIDGCTGLHAGDRVIVLYEAAGRTDAQLAGVGYPSEGAMIKKMAEVSIRSFNDRKGLPGIVGANGEPSDEEKPKIILPD